MRIRDYLGIIVLIAAIFLGFSLNKMSSRVKGTYKIEQKYKDLKGEYAMTIVNYKAEVMELESAYNRADSLRNSHEVQLAKAKETIEQLGIKLKNAKQVTNVVTKVTDTFNIYLKDTVYVKDKNSIVYSGNYTDGYLDLKIAYTPTISNLFLMYSITDTVYVVENWARKPWKNGKTPKKALSWVRPWQLKIDVKSSNPKAIIVNGGIVSINNGDKRIKRFKNNR